MLRTIDELTAVADPVWARLRAALAAAPVTTQTLPVDATTARDALHFLQEPANTLLGAVVLHTGGLIIDHGWIRVLGGGNPTHGLWSLPAVNRMTGSTPPDLLNGALLVATDVLGGLYAINHGLVPRALPGHVVYYAPDTLHWEPTGLTYPDWLHTLLTGRTHTFYAHLRWPGWTTEVAALRADEGLLLYPPPCTPQGRIPADVTRTVAPAREVIALTAGLLIP